MKAQIQIIESQNGRYDSGDAGSDSSWKMWPAWIVSATVSGFCRWGPVKYRPSAEKTHSGFSQVSIRESNLFNGADSSEAENHARSLVQKLEAKGFQVETVRSKNMQSQNLNDWVRWTNDDPSCNIRKQLRPRIEDLTVA